MVQLDVMAAAEPPHVQRFIVSVVMGIDLCCAADFAALLLQSARGKCSLNGKVGLILGQVSAAPVCLAGLAFQRRCPWKLWIIYHNAGAACRLRVRYTVGREIENSSARSLME